MWINVQDSMWAQMWHRRLLNKHKHLVINDKRTAEWIDWRECIWFNNNVNFLTDLQRHPWLCWAADQGKKQHRSKKMILRPNLTKETYLTSDTLALTSKAIIHILRTDDHFPRCKCMNTAPSSFLGLKRLANKSRAALKCSYKSGHQPQCYWVKSIDWHRQGKLSQSERQRGGPNTGACERFSANQRPHVRFWVTAVRDLSQSGRGKVCACSINALLQFLVKWKHKNKFHI